MFHLLSLLLLSLLLLLLYYYCYYYLTGFSFRNIHEYGTAGEREDYFLLLSTTALYHSYFRDTETLARK